MNIDPFDLEHGFPWPNAGSRSYTDEEMANIEARMRLLQRASQYLNVQLNCPAISDSDDPDQLDHDDH